MLSTPRVALAAMILAAPFAVANAATQVQDQAGQSAGAIPGAEPGIGMAQSDLSERPAAGMATQQPPDDDDDDDSAVAPGVMGGRGMMGQGMMGQGMMGQGMGGGMMGQGMRPMMQMMQGMMQMMQGMMQMMEHPPARPAMHGMMPGRFVEGHLAALKAELGITQAQEPQWNAFAEAMRARVKAMQDMRGQMMQQGPTASWPDRIAQHERRLSARLDALKAMEGPTKALWDALSDQQRHKAEGLMPGPMGMR